MSVESRPNKLTKGLVLDTFHTDVDNTVATYALNSQLEDQEGNHFHYGSEVGTTYIKEIPANHVVVGHINMERNETVLFTTDGTNSTIGVLSRNDDMSYHYEIKVDDTKQTKKLGFKKEGYVRGVYRLLNGCDKVIYFVDGVNKDRRININQLDSYKLPTTASVASGIIFDDSLRATIFAISSASGNIQLIRLMSASPEATANVLANLSSGAELTKLLTASANGIGTTFANLMRTANMISSVEATGTSTVNVDIVRLLQSNVSAIGSVNAILQSSQQGVVEIDVTLSGVASSTAILLRAALLEAILTTEASTVVDAILTRVINAQAQATANTSATAQITVPVNATATATATTAADAILSYAVNATANAMAETSATAQLSQVINASLNAEATSSLEALIGLVLVSTTTANGSISSANLFINRLLTSSVTAEGTTTAELLIAKLLNSSLTAQADTTTDLLVSKLLASTVDGLANVTANLQLADLLSTSLSGTATTQALLDIVTIILADPYIDNVSLLLQGDDKPAGVTQNNTFIDSSASPLTIIRNGNITQGTFSPFDRAITNSGGSAYFDGTGDYLTIADNAALELGNSNFTIESWVYLIAAPASAAPILTKRLNSGVYGGYELAIALSRQVTFTADDNTSFDWAVILVSGAGKEIQLNTWTHIAVTRSTSTWTLWLNGVSVATATASITINDDTTSVGIGAIANGERPINGYISNLRLVKGTAVYTTNFQPSTTPLTAITNTSLLLNFTNAAVFDGVKLNNVETVGNAQINTNIKQYGTGSLAFDGTTDALTVSSNSVFGYGTGNFTIEFWLYLNNENTATLVTHMVTDVDFRPHIYYLANSGIRLYINSTNVIVGQRLNPNQWYHIALSKSGSSTRLYVNGFQTGSTYTDNNNYGTSNYLAIGDYQQPLSGVLTLNGYIDDLRITKGIARYTTNFNTNLPAKLSSLIPNYLVNRSLRFNTARQTYLSRTLGTATNNKIWTWSGWIRRGTLGVAQNIFGNTDNNTASGNISGIRFNTNNFIEFYSYTSAYDFWLITTQVFRDSNAWYHLTICCDSTQATPSNRIKLYVNGIQITSFGTATYPALNHVFYFNSAITNYQGCFNQTGTGIQAVFDGYMAEVNFIDGQALTPTSFGELDLNLGTWIPKLYSGTYGRNGFRLKFSDITQLGEDYSGNNNNWTPSGFSVTPGVNYDLMSDSPINADDIIGNYATINSLTNSSIVYANGNLQTTNSLAAWHNAEATIPFSLTDKFYYEIHCTSGANHFAGIGAENTLTTGNPVGFDANSYAYGNDGNKYFNSVATAYGSSYTTNDIIGVAYNAITGSVWFSKNGVYQGSGNPVTGTNPAFTGITRVMFPIASSSGSGATVTQNYNFGQRPFAYSIPTGFKTLNTFNLPTPTIGATTATQANKFMDVSLYSGTGAAQSVLNSGFKPDFVWIKNRTGTAASHAIYDINRGVNKQLVSNSDALEVTNASGLTSFNNTGFSIGTLGDINTSGATYIAWQWKAGGTSSIISGSTISSLVSVSTISGFSVITYTGNGTAGATIAHGLTVIPRMVIVKVTTGAISNWAIYHGSLGNTSSLFLNTNGVSLASNTYWNNTNPTANLISLGTSDLVNANTRNYVAYAWAEIDGYSKFGSYLGNNSADGTFVYTGFKSKYILIKCTTAVGNWVLYNSIVDTGNPVVRELFANLNNTENSVTSGDEIDFLSNGFKLRSTNAAINAAQTYVYAAFAETPFKYATAD